MGRELVGRERELGALRTELSRCAAGAAGAVAITGEAGIGKSALLDALRREAARDGLLVLSGRATEFERDVPFAVLLDALDDHVRALGPAWHHRLDGDVRDAAAVVLPALADGAPRTSGVDRPRTHRALRQLLGLLAAERPLLLAIDDAQWADDASLQLLAQFVRRPPDAPVLLALACRRAPAPLAELLDGELRHVRPGPLAAQDARALVAGAVDASVAAVLHRESGGNPLFLLELLRARGAPASAPPPVSGDDDVPAALAGLIAAELERLEPAAGLLAEGAAIAGDPFDVELAAHVAGLGEDEAADVADLLVAAGLVVGDELPGMLRFRHPVVRGAVRARIGPARRARAHARAAALLVRRGAPPLERAHHLAACARAGDGAAVAVLAQAAAAAGAAAPAEAARWYAAALRIAAPGDERRGQLLAGLAGAEAALGRLDDARAALHAALALADPRRAAELTVDCARIEHLLGLHEEARARMTAALAGLADRDGETATLLRTELAVDALYTGDAHAAGRHAERAAAAAARRGDRLGLAHAQAVHAFAAMHAGDLARLPELLSDAAATVDALDDVTLARRLDAIHMLAHAEHWSERFAAAERHFARGIAVAARGGNGSLVPPLHTGHGLTLAVRGRLAEALASTEAGGEAARLTRVDNAIAWTCLARAYVAAAAGDTAAAVEAARTYDRAGRLPPASVTGVAAGWSLGTAYAEAGDLALAERIGDECAANDGLALLAPLGRALARELLVHCALVRGDDATARGHAERLAADATGWPPGLLTSLAARARAAVALAAGDAPAAVALAERADADAARAGATLDAARARMLAGRAHAAAGADDAALAALTSAEATFARCGAVRMRDAAAAELRPLGRRAPRRATAGDADGATLTPREREVAELVARGRSNKEIASELHISENTVDTHMRRVLSKLGVPRRAGVALALRGV